MATITKSFTESYYSSNKATWTVTLTQNDITVSDTTFSLATSGIATYVGSNKGRAEAVLDDIRIYRGSSYAWADIVSHVTLARPEGAEPQDMETSGGNAIAWNSNANVTLYRTMNRAINTANCFNESNNTVKTITLYAQVAELYLASRNSSGNYYNHVSLSDYNLGAIANVTLNAPPTFTHSSISYNTAYIYTGLTTASVTVSDLSAKYGGNITDVTFTIGNQSVSRTTAGTLSILLNTAGTFTPTITVTDSRGQTTTKALDSITVNGYVAPSVSFTADRTLQSGVLDDEGTYATVNATFRYTDVVATLQAPSVVLTNDTGAQTTPTVTWYKTRASNGTLSGAFTNWSTVANGDTVYGLIPNVSTQYSYQISIQSRDTKGTGTAIIQTVAPAFYTVDFLAGGHGIAFGQPSSQEGFFCNMNAYFKDKANIMRALFDFVYPVGSYYETSNTSFNPNTSWGGTWVLDSAGKVTVAYDSSDADFDNVGDSGGSKTHTHTTGNHTLTVDEIPSHAHNILAHNNSGSSTGYGMEVTSSVKLAWTASRIQVNGGGQAHNHGNTGSGSNVQPYVVVNRWHRTA